MSSNPCHPDRVRTRVASECEWKDPDAAYPAMPLQGVFSRNLGSSQTFVYVLSTHALSINPAPEARHNNSHFHPCPRPPRESPSGFRIASPPRGDKRHPALSAWVPRVGVSACSRELQIFETIDKPSAGTGSPARTVFACWGEEAR